MFALAAGIACQNLDPAAIAAAEAAAAIQPEETGAVQLSKDETSAC